MIVEPKVRGFICTTAHPTGCFENVRSQIEYVKGKPKVKGAKKALILGCSTGYGLASRISAAYLCGASTLGVAYENPSNGKRTANAGWYNTAAFETLACRDGLYAKTVIGDAFSLEIKRQVTDLVKKDLGKVDLVVYSLAAPRRTTHTGEKYSSVIKPIGREFTEKSINLATKQLVDVTVGPATAEEIEGTVKVMGGEDWRLWIDALAGAGVLAGDFVTVAYNYIGPEVTHPIYLEGTIGAAKADLQKNAAAITRDYAPLNGRAFISVNKALVTQASAAIPVVPLYISILFKIMKEKGIHEGCIEQMARLYGEKLYAPVLATDAENRFRLDDLELRDDVQSEVKNVWKRITNDNLVQLTDLDGYWKDFYRLFGFEIPGVDYAAEVDPDVKIPSLQ